MHQKGEKSFKQKQLGKNWIKEAYHDIINTGTHFDCFVWMVSENIL